MISIYGSTGFIGSRYCKMHSQDIFCVPREERWPSTEDVLYFISTTNNYHVLSNPFLDIETNLTVLIETLEACKKRQEETKKTITFNFISSWFVYGDSGMPAREDSPCSPKGFYSITKKAAEDLLISYCKTFGMNYRVLRLCNVIGGNDIFSAKKNALQFLVEKIKDNEPINLYFGGNFIRDYLHVDDICSAIHLCADKGLPNEIYNIGGGHPLFFNSVIDYIVNKTNSHSKITPIDQPDFHKIVQVKNMYLNTDKLENLGFSPKYNIWQALDKIL